MLSTLYSMTGYGRCVAEQDGRKLSVELKSVNHRHLDLNIRLFRTVSFLEQAIRETLQRELTRGHVDVFLHYVNEREDQREIRVDEDLARAYCKALRSIARRMRIRSNLRAVDLAALPDVVKVQEREEDEDALRRLLDEALGGAIAQLKAMRAAEGEKLKADVEQRLLEMEGALAAVEERAPQLAGEYRDRLRQRIAELIGDAGVDEGRLAMEVAIFADRACIDEEIVRLKSHIAHMRQILDAGEEAGRKLDFLVQEMNREVNTICSKANDIAITNGGLTMKSQIEKIREQIQNIE